MRFKALCVILEQNAKVCNLRTLSFERDKLDEHLDYIKEHTYLIRTGNRPTAIVQITGVGSVVLGKSVVEKLQVTYVHTGNIVKVIKLIHRTCSPDTFVEQT